MSPGNYICASKTNNDILLTGLLFVREYCICKEFKANIFVDYK